MEYAVDIFKLHAPNQCLVCSPSILILLYSISYSSSPHNSMCYPGIHHNLITSIYCLSCDFFISKILKQHPPATINTSTKSSVSPQLNSFLSPLTSLNSLLHLKSCSQLMALVLVNGPTIYIMAQSNTRNNKSISLHLIYLVIHKYYSTIAPYFFLFLHHFPSLHPSSIIVSKLITSLFDLLQAIIHLCEWYSEMRASDSCMCWCMLEIPGLRSQPGLDRDVEANLDCIRILRQERKEGWKGGDGGRKERKQKRKIERSLLPALVLSVSKTDHQV